MNRARALLVVIVLGGSLAACRRGALADWLSGKESPQEAASAATRPFRNAVDCPDGLARCVGGVVEVSRVARIPQPCTVGPEKGSCACPWDAVGNCPRGCAVEGLEVVVPPERARARVCAPDPSNPVARPAPLATPPAGACDGEGYRCRQSLVLGCSDTADGGWTARVVAACIRGCAEPSESVRQDEADPEGATRILCAP